MQSADSAFVDLPNELWISILEKLDKDSFLTASLVCHLWHQLVFNHLSHKVVLSFDHRLLKYPRQGVNMIPGRIYRNLRFKTPTLDSDVDLFQTVKQLSMNLVSLDLDLVQLDYQKLMQLLCPESGSRLKELVIKAKSYDSDPTEGPLNEPTLVIPSIWKLSFLVKATKTLGFLRMFPNVRELELSIPHHDSLDLGPLEVLAPQLKTLKLSIVQGNAFNAFLDVRLPNLENLDLELEDDFSYNDNARRLQANGFKEFLRSCCMLKTARLALYWDYDQQLVTTIFTSLPRVESLILCGEFASERISINDMQRMQYLKFVSLENLGITEDEQRHVVPMPSVEGLYLSSDDDEQWPAFSDVLRRFPRIKRISYIDREDLRSVEEDVPLLEELDISIVFLTPDVIHRLTHFKGLKKLILQVYDTEEFLPETFLLLTDVITLPKIEELDVRMDPAKSADIVESEEAVQVAERNEDCKLTVNGELVLID